MPRALWLLAGAVVVGAGVGMWAWRPQGRATEAPSPRATTTLAVEGMTCAGCAVSVKLAAQRVDGVEEVVVRLEEGTAVITYDPTRTSPEAIARAITDQTGFKTSVAGRAYNRS